MEQETAVALHEPAEVATEAALPIVHRDLRLVAENPMQLAEEQGRLIGWCEGKIADLRAHVEDLQSNLEAARSHKWKTSTLASAVGREKGRISYYEKMLAALQAGYFIVPNFDAEVFAVRTDRSTPPSQYREERYEPNLDDIVVSPVALGDGEHVRPGAREQRGSSVRVVDGKEVVVKWAQATAFDFDIDFPFALAKPQVMTATQAAMALRIFDDIAVLPRSQRTNNDPMVVGIIRRKEGYNIKRCTFLIAWFLDTETL